MHSLLIAALLGIVMGSSLILMLFWFRKSKLVANQVRLTDLSGSAIIHAGPANHFKNLEATGGQLYLLPDRLEFKSHQLNIQNYTFSIALEKIEKLEAYRWLGLIPNGLKATIKTGQTQKFVVNNYQLWMTTIVNQITKKAG